MCFYYYFFFSFYLYLRCCCGLAQKKTGVKHPETCAHLSGRTLCLTPQELDLILTGSKPLVYLKYASTGIDGKTILWYKILTV